MFSPWEPKLLMDVFILTDIIKHVSGDCVHKIYFDPQKYPVCNKFKAEGYSLLCKDLATSAINHGYQIVRNSFYVVGSLTAYRFFCGRCIQYKGDIKCWLLALFCSKRFHNDAINSRGVTKKKKSRQSKTQRPLDNEYKCSFFFSPMWWIWIFPCSKSREQTSHIPSKIDWWTNSIPTKTTK